MEIRFKKHFYSENESFAMKINNRAVSPVVATILVVAIVVILAATISVVVLDTTEEINEPTPNVAETTGEFEPGAGFGNQDVKITHVAGDDVEVEEIEIIVRASRPETDDTDARLIDLPASSGEGQAEGWIGDDNIEGNKDLITQVTMANQIIVADDTNTWSAGDTIKFSILSTGADFSEDASPSNAADELEVIIIYTPSDTIIFEDTFEP